jgi:SNF2 family DNA or RNA helicase
MVPMENLPSFCQAFEKEAALLLKTKSVTEPLFSRGTYQFEVKEGKAKHYPFLQLSNGQLTDFFCTCKRSEEGQGCPHLAAAYATIFHSKEEPLHLRFEKSFWNHLFQMISHRLGNDPKGFKKGKEGNYAAYSKTKKKLFSIEPKKNAAKIKLQKIVEKRELETEETSIKFSNLSGEEMAQYRAGQGSFTFLYELGLWADLAKWVMWLQEEEEPYEIEFSLGKEELPDSVQIEFASLSIWAYLPAAYLPDLIPSLVTVRSPLAIFDAREAAQEQISYDPVSQTLHVTRLSSDVAKEVSGIEVGEWLFVKSQGFYRKTQDPALGEGIIEREKIGAFLSQFRKRFESSLGIHKEKVTANYLLYFDSAQNFVLELYLFERGDVQALFPPFGYIEKKGFFQIEGLLFGEIVKVIPRLEVAEFIRRHRVWLHQFPGFQTHLGNLEAHLTYFVSPEGTLRFDAALNSPESLEETLDFEEWAYIRGSGFYMKKENRGRLPLHPGLILAKEEIGSFIESHLEELEQVQHFFASEPFVVRLGLSMEINQEGLLQVIPKKEYVPGIDPDKVQMFGDFAYVEGRGFSSLPPGSTIPERYRQEVVIPLSQEASFLTFELEALKPYFLSIDPRLQKPEHLKLKIRKIQREKRRRKHDWLVDLIYESEHGITDPFLIWDAFVERKKHLFSSAGFLSLKEPRFYWIRQLSKRRLDRKRGVIRLSTLEWIRLSIFEELSPPRGDDVEAEESRRFLQELASFETHRLLDISSLQAELRPYQEIGLQWLWFLYCHGLSGLLCDDMGLGKTHQAMALLAAISKEDKERENKYLVVCPTSVIYHWQELLQRFLPHLRVCSYYGIERSLDLFETQYDLLLTSYGILRTGREDLRSLSFETAFFDEIQVAKNEASQTHQVLRSLDAKMKLGLTGTPIENRLRELKALFDLVLPGYMPPDAVFREVFVHPIEKLREEGKKQLLSKLIKPFILRRKKSEVLFDLPEKIEAIAYCDLSEEQKEMYRETALSLKNTLYADLKNQERPISYVHVFSALSKLKQICDHPALVNGNIKGYAKHQSGKWDLFVELLQEAGESGQKVVVFSQYLHMLEIIEQHLRKKGIGFATIKGSTRDRSEQLRRFREDPACQVFTASLLAAGVGIDLTVASVVIHYDRWWNPAKENQATDRVHRIGQNRGVQVFTLVTKHTIEERIHELIEQKKGLLEEIVGQEEGDQVNYLSRDELLQIFESLFRQVE